MDRERNVMDRESSGIDREKRNGYIYRESGWNG